MGKQVFGRRWSVWMADTVLYKFPELRNRWAYDYGVVCKGLEQVYTLTGNEKYFQYIKDNMDHFVQEDGSIRYYEAEQFNLDYVNNGKSLLYLYQKTNEEKYLRAVHMLREQLKTHPRTEEGGFWHKKMYPNQMWLDGLYMAQPFYAEYVHVFEKDKSYEDVVRQFRLIDQHSKDSKTHLLYHGWDEKKECFWADKETGLSANFWGRSVGWYACALVDTLDYLEGEKARGTIMEMVVDLAEALVKVQSKDSGVWYQVLDKEKDYGNYPEASCSCMFTYFLLKAIRKGYIEPSYFEYARKAFYGLIRTFIEVDQDAMLNLKDTVYVSGLGGDKLRDGSYEYYISEPRQINNLLGIGAFLMASVEMELALYGE
ncbi:MAG: glycoside hydrolase family 88 protein [Lachnospiraceae bacterium]|nr:glycoside hydrolase family 88 protein [Lachnospiraceae bacterium]